MSDAELPPQGSPASQADELALALEAVASGDTAAFQDVYRRTAAKLFGVCLRILPTRQEAEEVLQEAYLTVWRRASSYDRDRGTAMAWLITLTRNRAVDRLRGAVKLSSRPIAEAAQIADPAPSPSDRLESSDEARRLRECLGVLHEDDAVLIRTAFFQGSTYAELATRSDKPLGTIKSRIRRALMKLKECLQ